MARKLAVTAVLVVALSLASIRPVLAHHGYYVSRVCELLPATFLLESITWDKWDPNITNEWVVSAHYNWAGTQYIDGGSNGPGTGLFGSARYGDWHVFGSYRVRGYHEYVHSGRLYWHVSDTTTCLSIF